MPYSDQDQALRVASAMSAVATGCCLRYGLFASILRQPATSVDESSDAFLHYYDLFRTIGLSTTEDMIHPTRTWLICRIGVPKPAERYFLQGFQRWHVEWVEVVSPEGIVLLTDPVLMSLQTIVGLIEEMRDHSEVSGRVRSVARPGMVSLDRVAQQYARVTTGIGTDQLWAALRQWGAATVVQPKSWVAPHPFPKNKYFCILTSTLPYSIINKMPCDVSSITGHSIVRRTLTRCKRE